MKDLKIQDKLLSNNLNNIRSHVIFNNLAFVLIILEFHKVYFDHIYF